VNAQGVDISYTLEELVDIHKQVDSLTSQSNETQRVASQCNFGAGSQLLSSESGGIRGFNLPLKAKVNQLLKIDFLPQTEQDQIMIEVNGPPAIRLTDCVGRSDPDQCEEYGQNDPNELFTCLSGKGNSDIYTTNICVNRYDLINIIVIDNGISGCNSGTRWDFSLLGNVECLEEVDINISTSPINNGNISLSVEPCYGCTYDWESSNDIGSISSSNEITISENGEYAITITNFCNDTFVSSKVINTFEQPCDPVQFNGTFDDIKSCGINPNVSVSVTGTAPFSYYLISNGAIRQDFKSDLLSHTFFDVSDGTYRIEVQNCESSFVADDNVVVTVNQQETWYQDADDDMYHGATEEDCDMPTGIGWTTTTAGEDCDDMDQDIKQGASINSSIPNVTSCIENPLQLSVSGISGDLPITVKLMTGAQGGGHSVTVQTLILENLGDAVFSNVQGAFPNAQDYFYSITVKNGCDDLSTSSNIGKITINAKPTISLNNAIIPCGSTTGSLEAFVIGGNSQYYYKWEGPNVNIEGNSSMIDNLEVGTYALTVTDLNNSCAITAEAYITAETDCCTPASIIYSPPNLTVCDGDDFDVNVTRIAGAASITVRLFIGTSESTVSATDLSQDISQNGDGDVQFSNIPTSLFGLPGTYYYSFVVTNGCNSEGMTSSISTLIVEEKLTASINITQGISVPEGADGSLEVLTNKDDASLTYLWSNGSMSSAIGDLASGTYKVTVSDNYCTDFSEISLTDPDCVLNIGLSQTSSILCNGAATGAIEVNVEQGNPTSYEWSNNVTGTSEISNLTAGKYFVTATENENCIAIESFTITEPSSVTVDLELIQNVSQVGATDGSAKATPTGGNSPYTYLWDNGETTQTATMLSQGDHSVIVTDANICSVVYPININGPNCGQFSSFITQTRFIDCNGETTASITANILSGSGSYNYKWSDNSNVNSSTRINLSAGLYDLTVTDQTTGCITESDINISEPSALSLTVVEESEAINGINGSATANPFGGIAPYTYLWSSGETIKTAEALTDGTNQVTITDANDCTITGSIVINDGECVDIPDCSLTSTSGELTCFAPEITLYGSTTSQNVSTFWILEGGQIERDINSITVSTPGFYSYYVQFDETTCLCQRAIQITQNIEISSTPVVSSSYDCDTNTGEYTYEGCSGDLAIYRINNGPIEQWTNANPPIWAEGQTIEFWCISNNGCASESSFASATNPNCGCDLSDQTKDCDGDGVDNGVDCAPLDANMYEGKGCDDLNDCTDDDAYNSNCECEGTLDPDCGNSTPTASDDTAETNQNSPVDINVLINDGFGSDEFGSIDILSDPNFGVAVVNNNNTIRYTPADGFTGNDSFTYQICDDDPVPDCATATVTVAVNSIAEPRITQPDCCTLSLINIEYCSADADVLWEYKEAQNDWVIVDGENSAILELIGDLPIPYGQLIFRATVDPNGDCNFETGEFDATEIFEIELNEKCRIELKEKEFDQEYCNFRVVQIDYKMPQDQTWTSLAGFGGPLFEAALPVINNEVVYRAEVYLNDSGDCYYMSNELSLPDSDEDGFVDCEDPEPNNPCASGYIIKTVEPQCAPASFNLSIFPACDVCEYNWSGPIDGQTNEASIQTTILTEPQTFGVTITNPCGEETILTYEPILDKHPDYDALYAFYMSTNGDGWEDSNKWLDNTCNVCEWHGIQCDNNDRVQVVFMNYNNLTGQLPPQLGDLEFLERLTLGFSEIGGTIPPQLSNLTRLKILELKFTKISGQIPPELGELSNLESLDFTENELSGGIPSSFENLDKLKNLVLWLNDLTGPIPPELGNLQTIEKINLGGNNLQGPIPTELGELLTLKELDLGTNDLTGEIPLSFVNLINLTDLQLDRNQLSGCFDIRLKSIPSGAMDNLGLCRFSNGQINSGNNFDALWSEFCENNEGVCVPSITKPACCNLEIENIYYCTDTENPIIRLEYAEVNSENWLEMTSQISTSFDLFPNELIPSANLKFRAIIDPDNCNYTTEDFPYSIPNTVEINECALELADIAEETMCNVQRINWFIKRTDISDWQLIYTASIDQNTGKPEAHIPADIGISTAKFRGFIFMTDGCFVTSNELKYPNFDEDNFVDCIDEDPNNPCIPELNAELNCCDATYSIQPIEPLCGSSSTTLTVVPPCPGCLYFWTGPINGAANVATITTESIENPTSFSVIVIDECNVELPSTSYEVQVLADPDSDDLCGPDDICPDFNDNLDADNDGVPNGCDICILGDDNLDSDGDMIPDACDICPGYNDNIDADNDGVPNGCDICMMGDDNVDSDGDTVPDACDDCDNNSIGTACEDGDLCTLNDTLDESCTCISGPLTTINPNAAADNISFIDANDGKANSTPSGGTAPYSYLWSNGETTQFINDLAPGLYTVVVTDDNDCSSAEESVEVLAVDCTSMSIELETIINNLCFGRDEGSITLSIIGGEQPYSFLWSNQETSQNISDLAAGMYTITITDGRGCLVTADAEVTEPKEIIETFNIVTEASFNSDNGRVEINLMGGISPYIIQWDNGEMGQYSNCN